MKKIAVLFGGNSTEKEVSVYTGLAVVEAIKDVYKVESINIESDYSSLHEKLLDTDIVFIALHGGYGEDGRLQKYLDKHNIKYTGSGSDASKIAMDKNKTKLIAKDNSIPVLNWKVIKNISSLDISGLNFPLIIKPNEGGSTIGLYFCKELDDFNINIKNSLKNSDTQLVEEYVEGREISVPILDGQVLPIIEIFPKGFLYDYDSKYKADGSNYQIPAKIKDSISRKLANDALTIYKKIGCRHYSRIDFLLVNDKYYFLEINTLPGLTSTSLLPKSALKIGLTYKDLVVKIIELAYSN